MPWSALKPNSKSGDPSLRPYLARECSATVGSPASVCVNDDLAACEACISVGATDHKAACNHPHFEYMLYILGIA